MTSQLKDSGQLLPSELTKDDCFGPREHMGAGQMPESGACHLAFFHSDPLRKVAIVREKVIVGLLSCLCRVSSALPLGWGWGCKGRTMS